MHRAVTAIYPTQATAALVREELESLGLGRHVTVLPEADLAAGTDGTYGDIESSLDRLHDLGLPEADMRTYQQALRNGDSVVSVGVDDDADLARIQEIMRRPEDAYDLDELDTRYAGADYVPPRSGAGMQMAAGMGGAGMGAGAQQQGYAGSGSMGQMGGDAAGYRAGTEFNEDGTVKVVEEDLSVGKRAVERGAVRVHSYVREEPVSAEVDLRSTRVYVERRPVDRPVGSADIATGERVIEAREVVEEPVVAKEARVVEEIGLRQETEVSRETIRDTVRKTEVEIEDTRTGETSRLTGDRTTDRDRF